MLRLVAMQSVLVVDDEPAVRESLRMLFKRECQVDTAEDVDSALRAVARSEPDLVLLDVVMPGRSGLELIGELRERGVQTPVIVLTATNTVSVAVEAMKLGAADFVTKPFELEALRLKVRQLLEHRRLEVEVVRLRDEVRERNRFGGIVGRSPVMQDVFRTVERLAASQVTVLITGESGTGKELAARAIHEQGALAAGPFVAVNCGAIAPNLIESELFGHERGAFTGAKEQRIGRFEKASGGTLFLDEIGDLPADMQVKLLRALQEREVERVGSSNPTPVEVRVLTATHRDLEEDVRNGLFRADLFYRINVVPMRMPPLRERREDIPLLAEAFLLAGAERAGAEQPTRLTDRARAALQEYTWPGNVRELQNAIEHGLALSVEGEIDLASLPLPIRRSGQAESLRDEWRQGRLDFDQVVARFETEILREALEQNDWNQTRAADSLAITRRVLKLKMDRFGIESND